MLRRKMYDRLMQWKSGEHKCLIVKGQRQVGKTFIIKRFGEDNYDNMLYINFATDNDAKDVFNGNLRIDEILISLATIRNDVKIVPGRTLIFFDEIQECSRARSSLKQFTIDGRYDVIASGSLLGIDVAKADDDALTPVGYEEHMTMYPLDFEEFLWGMGITGDAIDMVKDNIRRKSKINPAILKKFAEYFQKFMIVGGMPEAVQKFVDTNDYNETGKVLENILNSAYKDMVKYNDNTQGAITVKCFDSIPSQLSESNKRFTYSRIDNGKSRSSSRKYMGGLTWIEFAGYGNICYSMKNPILPIETNEDRDVFRLFLSDTGMLVHLCGLSVIKSILMEDFKVNKGGITENEIMSCLVKNGVKPHYFKRTHGENMMELDFIIELGTELVIIEVKSGKDREAPSIGKYPTVYGECRRIIFENGNVWVEDEGIEHYPLFAATFLDEMKNPTGIPELDGNHQ